MDIFLAIVQSGIIIFALIWYVSGLKEQIKSMNETMDVVTQRADEYEKLSDAFKVFVNDAPEAMENYKKMVMEINKKQLELLKLEKEKALEEKDRDIADLKVQIADLNQGLLNWRSNNLGIALLNSYGTITAGNFLDLDKLYQIPHSIFKGSPSDTDEKESEDPDK